MSSFVVTDSGTQIEVCGFERVPSQTDPFAHIPAVVEVAMVPATGGQTSQLFLTPDQARTLADVLRDAAYDADGK